MIQSYVVFYVQYHKIYHSRYPGLSARHLGSAGVSSLEPPGPGAEDRRRATASSRQPLEEDTISMLKMMTELTTMLNESVSIHARGPGRV